jgi:hypothetical protein
MMILSAFVIIITSGLVVLQTNDSMILAKVAANSPKRRHVGR